MLALGGAVPAFAAPKVALLCAPDVSVPEAELARADLEGIGLDVTRVELAAIPLGGALAPIALERATVAAALADARAQLVAANFAAVRKIAHDTDTKAAWPSDPIVKRWLAELALVAAEAGDAGGFARAAERDATLKLEAARWSPDVRAAYDRARRTTPAPSTSTSTHTSTSTSTSTSTNANANTSLPFATSLPERAGLARIAIEASRAPSPAERDALRDVLAVDAAIICTTGARARIHAEGQALAAACTIAHTPPASAPAQIALTLTVRPGPCVVGVHGEFRARDGRQVISAPSDKPFLHVPAQLLPAAPHPYQLDYVLWGETRSHARTPTLGTETAPLELLVISKPPPHWYRKWWVWTLIGTAAAAAIIVPTAIVYRPQEHTIVRIE